MSATAPAATRSPAEEAGSAASEGARRTSRRVLVVAIALALVPFAILLVRSLTSTYAASADDAAIELLTRGVGTLHTPLVGPFSRYGWNHPGPLMFYALFVPYRLFGGDSNALLAGTTIVNGAAAALSAWMCWRRGRFVGLVLGLLTLLLLLRAIGGTALRDPWNPYIIVLPMFAFVLAAWSVACGDHWFLPIALALASFAVQSHVGAALPAVALLGIAVFLLIVDARRGRVQHLALLVGVTLAVGVALWLPVLIEQLQPHGGNLSDILRFLREPAEPRVGAHTATRLLSPQLGVAPSFITGNETLNVFTGALDPHSTIPIVVLPLVGASIVAAWRRDRASLSLDVIALSLVATAWLSASDVVGVPFPYLLRWTWIVGASAWLAIAWTCWRALRGPLARSRARGWANALFGAAIAATGALLLITTVAVSRADLPQADNSALTRNITAQITPLLRGAEQPVIIDPAGGFRSVAFVNGVVLDLVKQGIPARRPADEDWVVGKEYTASNDVPHEELVVAMDDDEIRKLDADPRYERIAKRDTLTRVQRHTISAFYAAAAAAPDRGAFLESHGAEWVRAMALDAHGYRAIVYRRV